jgi:hypothetical protein
MSDMVSQPLLGWDLDSTDDMGLLETYLRWNSRTNSTNFFDLQQAILETLEYNPEVDVEVLYLNSSDDRLNPIQIEHFRKEPPAQKSIQKPLIVKKIEDFLLVPNRPRPQRFVCFTLADKLPPSFDYFVRLVHNEFGKENRKENRKGSGTKALIHINPPFLRDDGDLSDLNPINRSKEEARRRQLTSAMWSATVIGIDKTVMIRPSESLEGVGVETEPYDLKEFFREHNADVLTEFFSNRLDFGEDRLRSGSEYAVQRFNVVDSSDEKVLLEGLKHFVNQCLSSTMSLVCTEHRGGTETVFGQKMTLSHAVAYDPFALTKFELNGELILQCNLRKCSDHADAPDPWDGNSRSLWHLRHSNEFHHGPIGRGWDFFENPTPETWESLSESLDAFEDLVWSEVHEKYGYEGISYEAIINILKQRQQSADEDIQGILMWNLARLENLCQLKNTFIEITDRFNESPTEFHEFIAVFVKLKYFEKMYHGILRLHHDCQNASANQYITAFQRGDLR